MWFRNISPSQYFIISVDDDALIVQKLFILVSLHLLIFALETQVVSMIFRKKKQHSIDHVQHQVVPFPYQFLGAAGLTLNLLFTLIQLYVVLRVRFPVSHCGSMNYLLILILASLLAAFLEH